MNETLIHFEQSIDLGPTFVARLLGVAYPTYAQYRSGRRELPTYHMRHVEAFLLLSSTAQRKLIERYSRGN